MNIQVVHSIKDLMSLLASYKSENKTSAFIPTMGALHKGHLSLIEEGKRYADITIASIYVNQSQFNEASDFDNYPRTIEEDLKKLETVSCDIAFIPSAQEMNNLDRLKEFDVNEFGLYMEGKNRPGHFKAVAEVVHRFFSIVKPDFAIFGEKDYMQCMLIQKLAKELHPDLNLIISKTVREENGLAMSSRNKLLSKGAVETSRKLNELLFELKDKLSSYNSFQDFEKWKIRKVESLDNIEIEYFEIVENGNIIPQNKLDQNKQYRSCICAVVDNVRLIDNLLLN